MRDKRKLMVSVPFILLLLFCLVVAFVTRSLNGPTVSSVMKLGGTEALFASESTEMTEIPKWTKQEMDRADSRQEVYRKILNKAGRGLFAGHAVDSQFLAWVDAAYGEKVVNAVYRQLKQNKNKKTGDEAAAEETEQESSTETAEALMTGEIRQGDDESSDGQALSWDALSLTVNVTGSSEAAVWREQTGKSMHVLWSEFCRKYGYEVSSGGRERILDCQEKDLVKLDFVGDLNLADDWCTMKTLGEERDLERCISGELIKELSGADLSLVNNEFTYGDEGTAIEGKEYTFRAKEENVELLKKLGIDMVSLANNHSYDYGPEALLRTEEVLEKAGITAIGGGEDIDRASQPGVIIANGWRIAVVTATEVERFSNYTKEATETEPGVFKMTEPDRFLRQIRLAKADSDFVIAYVHWGQEGESKNSDHQHELAEQIVEAGADVIIGGHPHRLQGMEFIHEVPVIYSLGNFWFSDAALFTVAAQVTIGDSGRLEVRVIPLLQKAVKTGIITDEDLLARFYKYFADMSTRIAVDTRGKIYNLGSLQTSAENILSALSRSKLEWYTTGKAYSRHNSGRDIYGKSIDVVGNLR